MSVHPIWRDQVAAKRGYRSALRVAIRLNGERVAVLGFFSFAPAVYKEADLLVARRVRDRIALNLTRGRGAEALKRATEATARASQLEMRVRALTEELNARSGYRRVDGDSLSWRQALTQATQVATTETTVLLLGEAFIQEFGRSLGRPPGGLSLEARQALFEYHWPGNVRELRNVLERAAILCDGGLIVAEHLSLRPPAGANVTGRAQSIPPSASSPAGTAPPSADGAGDLRSVERAMIEKAMQAAHFNKSQTAKALGVTRAQLYLQLRKHGLD